MRFRCNLCREAMWPKDFVFEDHDGACPKCGARGLPSVVEMVDIHFMVLCANGPIMGSRGAQKVACQPRRSHLALPHGAGEHFSATGDVREVTCPRCKGTQDYKEAATLAGLLDAVADQQATVFVDLGGSNKQSG